MKSISDGTPKQPPRSPSFPLASILFLTILFYLNFLPRLILAPLMVTIEKELQIGHGEAGSLFLLISAGYCITFLFSGFIAFKLTHHNTIIMSSVTVGFMLIIISVSHSVLSIKIELFFLGVAAAPYFPSGLWLITNLTGAKHQGKAIAIHEIAPSLSFISAPIIAEIFLRYGSWRILLACLGILSIIMGLLNIILGFGKEMKGEPASLKKMNLLMKEPSFQIMCCLFVLGMGASIGLYTMMPLFLVHEHLFERGWANSIVSLSRLPGIATVLVAGFALDRFGIKGSLLTVLLLTRQLNRQVLSGIGDLWMFEIFHDPSRQLLQFSQM